MSRRRITAALGAASVTLILATGGASGRAGTPPGQQPPADQTPPSISGSAMVASTLTASPGTWQGKSLKFAYQWLRCNSAGGSCSASSSASGSSKTLSTADVGSTLRVIVTASNRNGSTAATSAQTAAVAGAATPPPPSPPPPSPTPVAPAATSLPVVSGTAQQNQNLTTSTGSWSGTTPMTYSYQWQRCGVSGASCAPISGATAASYMLAAADVGSTLRTSVTASNSSGSATASSNPTSVVSALPSTTPPAPTGGCNGCYFWWTGDPFPWNWRAEPSPFSSYTGTCYQPMSAATPAGSHLIRLHIGNDACADTGWGEKSMLNGWRVSDGNVEPNSHAQNGATVWYRTLVRFPSNLFSATTDNGVTFLEWHANGSGLGTGSYDTMSIVRADNSSGANPNLALLLRAGQISCSSGSPAVNTLVDPFPHGSLQFDHWYDIVYRITWAPDSSGQITWYVDGVKKYENLATPTLLKGCNGYVDQPDIDIGNYRRKDNLTPSSIDFALAADGPSAASIGFSP